MIKTILHAVALAGLALTVTANPIVFENATFRYAISESGTNLSFIDRASGKDFLRTTLPSPCAVVRAGNDTQPANAASFADDRFDVEFRPTAGSKPFSKPKRDRRTGLYQSNPSAAARWTHLHFSMFPLHSERFAR